MLQSITSVPVAASSGGTIPLTVPLVPTAMNAGVSNDPWGVVIRPTRAPDRRDRAWISNRKAPPIRHSDPAYLVPRLDSVSR
ncbi:MAG: hypothetical protein AMXMBFR77_10570 [Phycisphaerales bacterium]|nr:MAG: hypothetical protein BroJett004_04330 [Planctomycetota bacterium]